MQQRSFGGFNEQVDNFGSTAIMGQMKVDYSKSAWEADIKNDEVMPDVFKWTNDMVSPIQENRTKSPEDLSNVAPAIASTAQIQQALTQAMAADEGEPEKVHILEPEVYQNRANSNKPNPRTTFYNQDLLTHI